MPQPTLDRLTKSTGPRFEALLEIYLTAFPPKERKAAAQLRTMLYRPDYLFLLAESGNNVLGFAILFCSATAPVTLLEYLAIHPDVRGGGIGRWLYKQVAAQANTLRRPLLIEVESDLAATPGQAERQRRKQFYRTLGAREITGLAYRMPQVSTAPPPPMELMLHAESPLSTVPRAVLSAWLGVLYTEVYGQRPTDPRIGAMLELLPATIPIL